VVSVLNGRIYLIRNQRRLVNETLKRSCAGYVCKREGKRKGAVLDAATLFDMLKTTPNIALLSELNQEWRRSMHHPA